MDEERHRLHMTILRKLGEIEAVGKFDGRAEHAFVDWILDNFEARRCPSQLELENGGLDLCRLRIFHPGNHIFEGSQHFVSLPGKPEDYR